MYTPVNGAKPGTNLGAKPGANLGAKPDYNRQLCFQRQLDFHSHRHIPLAQPQKSKFPYNYFKGEIEVSQEAMRLMESEEDFELESIMLQQRMELAAHSKKQRAQLWSGLMPKAVSSLPLEYISLFVGKVGLFGLYQQISKLLRIITFCLMFLVHLILMILINLRHGVLQSILLLRHFARQLVHRMSAAPDRHLFVELLSLAPMLWAIALLGGIQMILWSMSEAIVRTVVCIERILKVKC